MTDLPDIFHKLAIMAAPERARGFALSDAWIVEIANEAYAYIRKVTSAPSLWQDIATAPKDGTHIHVFCKNRWLVGLPAYYISRQYLAETYGDADWMAEGWYPSTVFPFDLPETLIEPTHWMPLPPAPADGGEG